MDLKKNRNTILDFIREMGIIIVVLGHSMQINLPENETNMV